MYRATALIPTYRHSSTLPLATASVQAQARDEIEIFIVGDGVDERVRAAAVGLAAADRRIRFFDFPKGPRNGEAHRHAVLQQARGRIVCYQSDDDLWLPSHLNAMDAALKDADFVGSMHVNVGTDGALRGYYFDIATSAFTDPWLEWKANGLGDWATGGFGLTFAAHTLDAYRRLPEGWTTTPAERSTDQFMWQKFLRQTWCRVRSLRFATALHFPAFERADWTQERCAVELQHWADLIARPDGIERIYRAITEEMGDRLLRQSLADRRRREEESAQARAAADRSVAEAVASERARLLSETDAERVLRRQAEAERDTVLRSTSWRLTAPARAVAGLLKSLRSRRGA